MNKRQIAEYKTTIQSNQKVFHQRIAELADRIRDREILPLCVKHKLTFTSGHGIFFFTDEGGDDYSDPDTIVNDPGYRRIQKSCKPILLLLNEKVADNQVLGYYVRSVERGELLGFDKRL